MTQEPKASFMEETRFRDFFATIKRRWFLIFLTMLIVMGLAALYSAMVTPVYRSVTLVEINAATANNPGIAMNPLSPYTPYTPTDIDTDIQVFQSYDVLRNALIRLNRTPPQPTPDLVRDPQITVIEAGPADALQVSVDSRDSDLCQQLATILPGVFEKFQLSNQQLQLNDTITFIKGKFDAAKTKADNTNLAMEAYRQKYNISDFDLENQSRLRNLEDAQAAQSQAAEQVAQTTNALASIQGTYDATPATINAPQNLSSQDVSIQAQANLTDLEGKLANAKVLYRSNSPEVKGLQAQVTAQQRYVDKLPKTIQHGGQVRNPILDSLMGQLAQARASHSGAEAALAAANDKVIQDQALLDQLSKAKGPYDILKQNFISEQNDVQTFQAKLINLQQKQSESVTPVNVIGEATPAKKVKPNWILNMVAAFIFGLIISWASVSIYERWDDRIYASDMNKGVDGLRSIGAVPLPASTRNANSLVVASDSPMADSFRVLRSNLLFTVSGEALRSISVVSARNNEGRTDIAANLAASLSMGSHQVILIDANLRRPSLHRLMNLVEAPGLTDVLLGYKKVKDVIQESSVEGLSMIAAGTQSQSSTELLSSEAFGMMLDELKDEFHFIIVDTTACLAGADAQVTADACDAAVFVMKVGVSRRSATRYCVDLLRRTRTNLIGVIYNRPGHNPRSGPINIDDFDDESSES